MKLSAARQAAGEAALHRRANACSSLPQGAGTYSQGGRAVEGEQGGGGGKEEPIGPGNASSLDIRSLLEGAGAPSTGLTSGRNNAAEGK